jgi:hypothetical protein
VEDNSLVVSLVGTLVAIASNSDSVAVGVASDVVIYVQVDSAATSGM